MAQASSASASEQRGHERDTRADWDYKTLFHALPGAYLILATDPDFTIIDASDSYLAATMQRREKIVGRPLFETFPDSPADRRSDGVSNLRASLQRALARKQPDTMAVQKYDIRTPAGTFEERYWTPINTPLATPDGHVAAIIHHVQDVTDFVRLSRRRGRAVNFRSSADTVADVYLRSREAVNRQRDERAAVAITSHRRARSFRRSLQAAAFVPALAVAILAGLLAWQGAQPIGVRRLVGPIALAAMLLVFVARVFRETAMAYEVSLNEEAAQAAALEELSGSLELRIKERTAELQDALQELETFAYTVSHDLRAPLRHVNGFVQLLKQQIEGQVDEKARHYMQRIESQSGHMGSLIDDLLMFSRIGRAPLQRAEVDLDELVHEVRDELVEQAAGREVEWAIHPLGKVQADRGLLRVVFVNLLSNALKYTRRTPHAKITIGRRLLPGKAEIYVQDNGAGFDPRYIAKLFGVFQRLHSSEQFEGSGIGLATVRRIITRHGGHVRAEGAVGNGATFYVSIPFPIPLDDSVGAAS